MLFKSIALLALASSALAAPQGRGGKGNGATGAQAAKIAEVEATGLNCQPSVQGTFFCDDGTGRQCFVNQSGGGSC